MERLLKQHEDFQKTLMAQEERRRTLSDVAVGMARAGHFQKEWYVAIQNPVVVFFSLIRVTDCATDFLWFHSGNRRGFVLPNGHVAVFILFF